MDGQRFLVTGDFWHPDFQDVLSGISAPMTLLAPESILQRKFEDESFSLILVAEARPGQIDAQTVEHLQRLFPTTPVVALCGSWCEGETRSGAPNPGLIRIYWHQWNGRYDAFAAEFNSNQIASWQLPRTATAADRMTNQIQRLGSQINALANDSPGEFTIGIGAWTQDSFEMLKDSLATFRYNAIWIEQTDWDGRDVPKLDLICIDANSLSQNLQENIKEKSTRFPGVPIIVVLNFPRKFESNQATQLGISAIVSKPYELVDLKFAAERAIFGAPSHQV